MKKPQTWHYGLVAQWWAEFVHDGPEIAYYQGIIERYGQPALDVGCGSGRLLLPYLQAGLDVDGCDISADMLAVCREKATQKGLAPRLYEQAMHALDLPRSYKTIIICGSFGLGGDRQQDLAALRRFHQYLEPGGVLAFDLDIPYRHHYWQYTDEEKRRQLPEEWSPVLDRKRAADGTAYELRKRLVAFDPLELTMTNQIRIDLRREGQLIKQEAHTLKGCLYFKNETLSMLREAGFGGIIVQGDFTEAAAAPEHNNLVFIARK